MAAKRYELSEAQWAKIAPLLAGKATDSGRTGADNRLFVNGCLCVLRSGAHWCDLPDPPRRRQAPPARSDWRAWHPPSEEQPQFRLMP